MIVKKYSFNQKYGLNAHHQIPEDLIDYSSSHSLRHIEINLAQEILSVEKFTPDRITKLMKLAAANDIQFSFHIPYYINIAEVLMPLRKSNIRYLLDCIRVAAALKVTHLTLHIGSFYWFPVEQWERKKALNRFVKSFKQVLNFCEESKVIIALENLAPIPRGSEYYLLGDNIADFDFLFSQIDSDYLKFCLDTGHANMSEGAIEYLRRFHQKLCCIHYHDNNGSDDEHLPVGKGTVPWAEMAAELIEMNYNGPIISECRNIEAYESAILFERYFNETAMA